MLSKTPEMRMAARLGLLIFTLFLTCGVSNAATWYVDDDAADGGTGTDWSSPFDDFQDALNVATSGDEIRVAQGTYNPSVVYGGGFDEDLKAFQLVSGVAHRGGFAGPGTADPDFQDPEAHQTQLVSNGYRVVVAEAAGPGTRLEGFVIRDANTPSDSGTPTIHGAGLLVTGQTGFMVSDCQFIDNHTGTGSGGGIYVVDGDGMVVNRCRFVNNTNNSGQGGGIYCDFGLVVLNSFFLANRSPGNEGGGAYSNSGTFINCEFRGNYAGTSGGGVYGNNLNLTHCVFSANRADNLRGGGARIAGSEASLVSGCTFADNFASNTDPNDTPEGGGLYGNGQTVVVNSIFWDNDYQNSPDPAGPEDKTQLDNVLEVNFTCIQFGWNGTGSNNISDDPLFVDQLGPDGQVGQGGGMQSEDNNLHLMSLPFAFSTSTDSGSNAAVPPDTHDVDGDADTSEPTPDADRGTRIFGGTVNRGAYEGDDCDQDNLGDLAQIQYCNGDLYCMDCNQNFIPDGCDIQILGNSNDCNTNDIPDECEIRFDSTAPTVTGFFCMTGCDPDCNNNGVPDSCDIASGFSDDCNGNGIPDECGINGGFPNGGEIHCGPFNRPNSCVIADCNPDGSEPGCMDCNGNGIPDACDILSGTVEDCNTNGIPDQCDIGPLSDILDFIVGAGSESFRTSNVDVDLYETMIGSYGLPWASGTNQTPMLRSPVYMPNPAEELRALAAPGCGSFVDIFARVAQELNSQEMLLGNEAYSDALDPTVGYGNNKQISPEELIDLYAFQGVPGINTLLDEELALLRGRELPGQPADWLDDDTYYPFYNRLPHNADNGAISLAYTSTYDVPNNGGAEVYWPQGHGDAYGYYLRAVKVYIDGFRGTAPDPMDPPLESFARTFVELQPGDMEMFDPGDIGGGDQVGAPYQGVRNMLDSMASCARTSVEIVDRTFRKTYRENVEMQILEDSDPERAWGLVDWAKRGSLGAYFGWAVANQLIPPSTDDSEANLEAIHRENLSPFQELTTAVHNMQERVETAATGLNPLGLPSNVVSFQIDTNRLDTYLRNSGPTGASHYQQMAELAENALDSAQTIFEWANEANQRIRMQAQDQGTFAAQTADSEAEFRNRLIEIFGYPSPTDIADNDLDGVILEDLDESQTRPDLVNFMLTDDEVANMGWAPRLSPGEIQLAYSEFKIAGNEYQQAENALSNLQAEIQDKLDLIELRTQINAEEISIINLAGEMQVDLVSRLEEIEFRKTTRSETAKWLGVASEVFNVIGEVASSENKVEGIAKLLGGGLGIASSQLAAAEARERGMEMYDVQREQLRVDTWKEAELAGLENQLDIAEATAELQALIRETPQALLGVTTAREAMIAAYGRLNAAISDGIRVLSERERVRALEIYDLETYRWRDLAFRTFRNNALQKYSAFFDLASRYVLFAARAFSYEYPTDRNTAEGLLEDLHRARRLGRLRNIIVDLDNLSQTAPPFTLTSSPIQLSFRRLLYGLSSVPTAQGLAIAVNTTTNVITTVIPGVIPTPIDNPFLTGDAVIVETAGVSLPPPLEDNRAYFLRRIDSRTFTLHTNKGDSLNGENPVDITGDGNPPQGSFVWYEAPDLDFRAFLESRIVDEWQDLPEVQPFVAPDPNEHFGPAILLRFSTDTRGGRNYFGNSGELFGSDNLGFGEGRNVKFLRYAINLPGVAGGPLGDPTNISAFLIPVGQSLFNGRNASEDPRTWTVVDQNIPRPPLVSSVGPEVENRNYNPWALATDVNGHLGLFRPIRTSLARIDGTTVWNPNLAARSAWNSDWLLVIPGAQFSGNNARQNLLLLIYGPGANPTSGLGINDIELTIESYTD